MFLTAMATAGPGRVFDIRDFGARGDGVTNDIAAVRGAYAAAAAAGGGTVMFPVGVFSLVVRPRKLTRRRRKQLKVAQAITHQIAEARYRKLQADPAYQAEMERESSDDDV